MFRGTGPERHPSHCASLSKLAIGIVVATSFVAFPAQGVGAITLSFNHAVLVAGRTVANVVTPASAPLTVTPSSLRLLSGTYTVDPSGVSLPPYRFNEGGVRGTINTTLKNTANGTLNFATGDMNLAGDFVSTVTIRGLTGSCALDTGTVSLSTANTQPLMGVGFPVATPGSLFLLRTLVNALVGARAMGGTWSSLSTTPAGAQGAIICTLLTAAGFTGPGGLWVSRNLTGPSPTVTVVKPKSVKAGRTATVKVKVTNLGQVRTEAIRLCLKARKGLKVRSKCQVTDVAGGKSAVVSFRVKALKTKRQFTGSKKVKTYKLLLTSTATAKGLVGLEAGRGALAPRSLKLKVRR